MVVVTMDTVRADHLGIYGYRLPTSPHFDAFARGATLFTRAIATSPWTVPTHASLFTGLDPFEHGAVTYYEVERPGNAYPLAAEQQTLAEMLLASGFKTGAFVANTAYLHPRQQLDQGFDTYVVDGVPGAELNQRIFPWLDRVANEPFFLFVNYMDSHRPYNTRPLPGSLLPPPDPDGEVITRFYDLVMPGRQDAPAALVDRLASQYNTGIAHSDAALGELLGRLETLQIADSTLVVVTSDHGEYLGEHRLVEHGKDLYQEAIWVPLAIRFAGQREGVVEQRVISSADVPGLLVEGLADRWRRPIRSLLPQRSGGGWVMSEVYFARTGVLRNPEWAHRFRRIRRAIYDWPYKYIRSSDGEHELYDLVADPREQRNLVGEDADRARRMADLLAARLEAGGGVRRSLSTEEGWELSPTLSESEIESLRALGYID